MRLALIGGVLGSLMLLGAQMAMAQGQDVVARTDPSAGSPAGVIYKIPLDSGRRDAAPVLHVGSRGSGSTSATPGSGSSSQVKPATTGSASASHPKTPAEGSSIHSENGFGSASRVPGTSPAALKSDAGLTAARTAGSSFSTYLLIALIAVAAIAAGLLATRRSGSTDRDPRPPAAGT